MERLARLTKKDGATGCWVWQGHTSDGYGRVSVGGHNRRAHRICYELMVGRIPDGMEIDHLCRNRACINPSHLEPVTKAVNIARSSPYRVPANSRKTHCPKGHAYAGDNLLIYNGWRYCGTCLKSRKESLRKSNIQTIRGI